MPHRPLCLATLLLATTATGTLAQTSPAPNAPSGPAVTAAGKTGLIPGTAFQLQATDPMGRTFNATAVKGKVAVIFYWSTQCAVCRNSLPELRANMAGWRDKPFTLILVNADRRSEDWLEYERLVSQMQAPIAGLMTLRQDTDTPPPPKLPLTLLVDAKGKVISRYEGRLAPEVWDGVADLLP